MAEGVIKKPFSQYKSLVPGGIRGNGAYTTVTNVNNITDVIFYFVLGGVIRQSVVYSGDQLATGLCFPDIYLGGSRAYMYATISGSTLTISSYTVGQEMSNSSWVVAYR